MARRTCLAVILAAGEGTRMRSSIPKVMHKVGGLPMLGHVIAAAEGAGASRLAVVIGPNAEASADFVRKTSPSAGLHVQKERLGTAHAVLAAKSEFKAPPDDVLVLFGDTPLVGPATLKAMRARLARGADVVVLGFRPADPARYGRLIVENSALVAIREYNDASPEERRIGLCNAGVMAFRGGMAAMLRRIKPENAKGEYYLTDLVEIVHKAKRKVVAAEVPADEVLGVNSRAELALAERVFQDRRRAAAMAEGVTLIAPDTVTFSHDTVLGQDVTIEPNVVFGPGVVVEPGATIRAFCHIEGARIAGGAIVGPFARLRPGAVIAENAHIGNFVEIKNAAVDAGAKVNHLTYIGDAHVGARANIGAGTITCNYDGFGKYHTEIGANAFVGSNSSLVAPVTIGEGAFIGSGSVITKDIPPDALAVGRGRQENKEGWAAQFRAKMRESKAAKSRS